ncbi:MAG TPA: hypothetical protein VK983_01900 [Candidatus Limnocylindrales bacterium]|nr:hypothetical protein [Candidatus Limnocylindrales bacterium]
MTSICPTITAATADEYRQQVERIAPFATRVHIDIADGTLAPSRLVDVANIWWPGGVRADLHIMTKRPLAHLQMYIALGPQLVIVHAEGEGNFVALAEQLHHHGIEVGVALLPQTPVENIVPALELIDHVLIFSGNFGHFGGHADMTLLDKVRQLKAAKPTLEIGWDGGVSDDNIYALAQGGVEVMNVGGYLHRVSHPEAAYARLESVLRPPQNPRSHRIRVV